MPLEPLYRSENLRPAFQLRYSWTGWLKSAWKNMPDASILDAIDPLWEQDGLRKSHKIASISVMPDHLHLALRGNIDSSPMDIAIGFQNNLAFAMGQVPIWQEGFYSGTFSEYDMGAVRRSAALAGQPDSPSGKPDGVWE
ncbi:MAG: hypothetical protein WCJ35_06430 [Planctomycetota bacterium]